MPEGLRLAGGVGLLIALIGSAGAEDIQPARAASSRNTRSASR
jgi:hypothetical protein